MATRLAETASFISQIHLCRKKVASHSCHFYNNVEGKGLLGAAPAAGQHAAESGERAEPGGPTACWLLSLGTCVAAAASAGEAGAHTSPD